MAYDLEDRRARAFGYRPKTVPHPSTGEELRIVTAVSHFSEVTLGLTLRSLDRQSMPSWARRVVARLSPMCASFNAALDYAQEQGADLLFHTASDVVVEPDALGQLVERIDLSRNYLAVGRGFDMLNGSDSPCGIWVFNMRIIGSSFRFRDVFKQDLDFCARVEDATGTSRIYSTQGRDLAYHHPIWTAEELYGRLRYSGPKYTAAKRRQYRSWLDEQLRWNPDNVVLLAGVRALERAEEAGPAEGSKDAAAMHEDFLRETADLGIRGREFYVHHSVYKNLARRLLRSSSDCVAVDERDGRDPHG